jgi:hypothetical protein
MRMRRRMKKRVEYHYYYCWYDVYDVYVLHRQCCDTMMENWIDDWNALYLKKHVCHMLMGMAVVTMMNIENVLMNEQKMGVEL